jgi:uncharacterized RDD family membrane protein YckC
MKHWFYSDYERNRLGPVAATDLSDLHHAGQLQGDTLVWREGMANWRAWREVMQQALAEAEGRTLPSQDAAPLSSGVNPYAMAEPAFAAAPAGPAATPLSSGVNPYAMAEPASPYAPPRTALHDTSTWVGGHEIVYAGFWKRFAAYTIDSFLVGIVTWIVQMVVMAGMLGVGVGAAAGGDPSGFLAGAGIAGFLVGMILVPLALNAVYFAWMHSSSRQATLGKMAVGIKVTDDNGHAISFMRGIGRFLAGIVSSLTLCIGYLMAAFTDRKRALHDMMASTLVVDQWAFTANPERQNPELGTVTKVIIGIALALVAGYVLLIVGLVGLGLASR